MRPLRFWTPPDAGFDTLRLLRARLKGLERSRKISVEVRVLTYSALWARFVDGLKGGPLPDAAAIPGHWTASLDRLGLLRGLASAAPAFDLSAAYAPLRPHALSPLSGEPVSVPWWMEVGVLQARPDLLEECGVDPGSLGDWEGLSAACKRLSRLRRRGIAPLTGADPMRPGTLEDLAPRIWSRGGEFLSPDGSRALFAREEAGRAFLDVFGLVEAGSVPLSGPAGLPPGGISSGSCALQ
ncbi:MAG: ABC transporter substrate-binding protein, partial [Elusimicrobiota bacterium]